MTLQTADLHKALQAALQEAQTPYRGTIGEVYMEKAWRAGAEYMARKCVEIVAADTDETRP